MKTAQMVYPSCNSRGKAWQQKPVGGRLAVVDGLQRKQQKTCTKRRFKRKHTAVKSKSCHKTIKSCLNCLTGRLKTLGLSSWAAPTLSSTKKEGGQLSVCVLSREKLVGDSESEPHGDCSTVKLQEHVRDCVYGRSTASRARPRNTRFSRLDFLGEINFIKCWSSHGIPNKQLDKSAPLRTGW